MRQYIQVPFTERAISCYTTIHVVNLVNYICHGNNNKYHKVADGGLFSLFVNMYAIQEPSSTVTNDFRHANWG